MSAKPRLCEILGVEVDEKFTVKGFKGTSWEAVYHIDSDGDFINDDESKNGRSHIAGYALCYAIRHPEEIVYNTRWTEVDKTNAKAIKQLWPGTNRVAREGTNAVLLGKDDITILTIWNTKMFPSLRDGETVDLDEILKEEDE